MDNQRIFLWLALLFVLWLNVDAWMKDYGTPSASAPTPTTVQDGATAVGTPTSVLTEQLPTIQESAQPGATRAATGLPEAGQDAVAGGTVHVVTDVLDLVISLTGGSIVRADLLKYPVHKDKPDIKVRLFNTDSSDSLYLYQSGLTTGQPGRAEPNHLASFGATDNEYRLAEGSEQLEVPLTWTDGSGLTVTKIYVLRRGAYEIGVRYEVGNTSAEPVSVAPYAQLLRHWIPVERSMFDVESYAFRGPAIYDGESYRKLNVEDEEDRNFSESVTGGWVAAMQHHFVAAIAPPADEPNRIALKVEDKDYLLRVVGPTQTVAPAGRLEIDRNLYVGPKLQAQLKQAGPRLELTADYGKLTILAQPLFWLLEKVHGLVGNWGWAIIIVTFLIKLVFYKLAETSGRSMAKMRTVAPRMKAIQERYKDDREGQARAMMDLYKREKINPVAGCLPMLVQIPFFLAFYWVLLESVEMRQAPFMFWIQDLSSRDPFFILPLLMGGAMFLQFKLNPTPPDPVQAKVFAFMPVVMTAMFAWFPAGLVLYWLTNTVLSIAQQWKINKLVEAGEKKRRTS